MPYIKSQNKTSTPRTRESESLRKFLWLHRNFAYCLGLSALVWFVGLGYYIENFIGWASVLALAPTDFSSFLLSAIMPLLFVWFLLAYIERSSSLDANATLFGSYIDSLMYPDDDATQNAKAIAKILQEQVGRLQKESKAVVEQSAQVKTDLEARIEELAKILQLLDTYSGKTLIELNDGVKTLADKCSYITDKTTNSVNNMRDCSADITQNASDFLSKINPLLDEISAVSSNVKNSIANNKLNLEEIKNQLASCADISQHHIDNMLAKTAENTLRIEQSFYKTAEECDILYKRMDTSISSIEGRVEEQKRLIGTQTKVLDHNSELLNNKLAKYGKTISMEIDKLVKNSVELEKTTKKQISALKAVNSETGKAIHGIGDAFDEKRIDLERRCEFAVNSMQNVIIAINKETDKLISFTNLTQAKNFDLQNITETIVDKVGDISNKLALKTDALKDKAVDVIDRFTEAHELISKSTDKINSSSNLIVNNGKEGVKLLEEQNFYINNAITNMDLVKEKLDRLRTDIKKSSEEVTATLANYEKQISKYEEIKETKIPVQPPAPEFSQDTVLAIAKNINKILHQIGIKTEKLYADFDIFDLWEGYLNGNNASFSEVLSSRMTRRQTMLIRKAFDDNIEFHNFVIKYLFLMDVLIKEMTNSAQENRNELLNFSVNGALDKVYFILVKALNSAE